MHIKKPENRELQTTMKCDFHGSCQCVGDVVVVTGHTNAKLLLSFTSSDLHQAIIILNSVVNLRPILTQSKPNTCAL